MGRKNLYNSHVKPYLEDIGRWKSQGLTEESIAENLNISYSAFKSYKNSNEELKNILMYGDREICKQIYNAVLEQAMPHKEVVTKIRKDGDGNIIFTETTEKTIPPDYKYLVLYLINHDPNFKTSVESDNW